MYFDGYDPSTNSLVDAKNWNDYPPEFLTRPEISNIRAQAKVAEANGAKLELRISNRKRLRFFSRG